MNKREDGYNNRPRVNLREVYGSGSTDRQESTPIEESDTYTPAGETSSQEEYYQNDFTYGDDNAYTTPVFEHGYSNPYNLSAQQNSYANVYDTSVQQNGYTDTYSASVQQSSYADAYNTSVQQNGFVDEYNASVQPNTYADTYDSSAGQNGYTDIYNPAVPETEYADDYNAAAQENAYAEPDNAFTSGNTYEDISLSFFETSSESGNRPYSPVSTTPFATNGTKHAAPSNEETLSEAELEKIRRERAARRKKRAERERRRRERRRQAIIRCSILLLVLILLIVGIVKIISGIWKHFHKDNPTPKKTEQIQGTTETPTTEEIKANIDDSILAKELPADREAALALLQTQGETDPDIKNICDNAAIYPDKILQCLAVNPEIKQFAIDYPAKINIVFDGEFSMDIPEGEVPLYLQYDERWGYADYGNSIIGINGCGPTCLSMAYTYLNRDGSKNPIKVADFSVSSGYLDENGDTSWALMTDGARTLGLTSAELALSKENMTNALEEGKVIICSMNSGDFTKNGHYILIKEYRNGLFYVNDPNSEARSQVGWDYERLGAQISNMWALGAGTPGSGQDNTGNNPADGSNDGQNGTTQTGDGQNDSQTGSTTQTDGGQRSNP